MMKRRNFCLTSTGGILYLLMPSFLKPGAYAGEKQYQITVHLLDSLGKPIKQAFTAYPEGMAAFAFSDGVATAALLLKGDPNRDGIFFGKDDFKLVDRAAETGNDGVIANENVKYADVAPDGKVTLEDAANFAAKYFHWPENQIDHTPRPGEQFIVSVKIESSGAILGADGFPMSVRAGEDSSINLFKVEKLLDPYLAERYSNSVDIFTRLTNTNLELIANDSHSMLPKTSAVKRWDRIKVDYRDRTTGQDYLFAGINHSQIMRDEAAKLNQLLGYVLFEPVSSGHDVSIDYSAENSAVAITLFDSNGNPTKGNIRKKKYSGAENWSRAEAQRLLLGLALGINIPQDYFPDERIAVESRDRRIPSDVTDVFRAVYILPKGFDIKVLETYERKPALYAAGEQINSEIVFDIAVPYPDEVKSVSLEELVAGKETREYWSGERILKVDSAEKVDPGKYRAAHTWLWPGPRRIRATAEYNDGTKRTVEQDLMVKTDQEPGYLKGDVLSTGNILFDWVYNNLDYYVTGSLNRLKERGVNLISLAMYWQMDDNTKTNIYPNNNYVNERLITLSDEDHRRIISHIRDFGMKVMFKPHIFIKNGEGINLWQGHLKPENDNWDALFDSHLNFLLHYAELGKELGVEYYVIGSELNSMTLPNWRSFGVPDPDPRWRHIIDEVRKVYDGKLTASLGSNQYGHENDVRDITFWDALDFIGFEPYFGLTGGEDPINNGKNDPTLQELRDGFSYWAERALLPTVKKYNKKVIITESAYFSFDGVNKNPTGVLGPMSNVVDWKEQADLYNVLFDYFRKNPDLLDVLTMWSASIGFHDADILPWYGSWDNRLQNPDKLLSWIYGKPAEKVIEANWKK